VSSADATVHADEMLGVGVDMDFRFFDAEWLVGEVRAAGLRKSRHGWCVHPYPDVEVHRPPGSTSWARRVRGKERVGRHET